MSDDECTRTLQVLRRGPHRCEPRCVLRRRPAPRGSAPRRHRVMASQPHIGTGPV